MRSLGGILRRPIILLYVQGKKEKKTAGPGVNRGPIQQQLCPGVADGDGSLRSPGQADGTSTPVACFNKQITGAEDDLSTSFKRLTFQDTSHW